jgi:hypothetical protein
MPMNKALRCIAHQKGFVVKELSAGLIPETNYSVTLNNMNSVPLSSTPRVYLVAGQTIRIYEWHPGVADEQYRVQAVSYTYAFTTKAAGNEVELLRFEWRRESDLSTPYPRGHLHVGPGLLATPTVIRPGDFHKAHIPTKRISFEAIVRFAITELNVRPQQAAWETTLAASEAAFEEHKTE